MIKRRHYTQVFLGLALVAFLVTCIQQTWPSLIAFLSALLVSGTTAFAEWLDSEATRKLEHRVGSLQQDVVALTHKVSSLTSAVGLKNLGQRH